MSPMAPSPTTTRLSLSTVVTMAPFSILSQNSALKFKNAEMLSKVHLKVYT